jgi:hypothetical protein
MSALSELNEIWEDATDDEQLAFVARNFERIRAALPSDMRRELDLRCAACVLVESGQGRGQSHEEIIDRLARERINMTVHEAKEHDAIIESLRQAFLRNRLSPT